MKIKYFVIIVVLAIFVGEIDGCSSFRSKSDGGPSSPPGSGFGKLAAPTYSNHHQMPSNAIRGVSFDFGSLHTAANGTDNFPMTWAADGHHYTVGGDGNGFNDGARAECIVSRLTGPFPGRGTDLFRCDGKGYGILALDDRLFVWVGRRSESSGGSMDDAMRQTWLYELTLAGKLVRKTKLFEFADGVVLPTWLQLGRNYEYAFDGYIYGYSSLATKFKFEIWETDPLNGKYGIGDNRGIVWLFRVPRGELHDRDAYQWYRGEYKKGTVAWGTINQKLPCIVPNKVLIPAVAYSDQHNRYIFVSEANGAFKSGLQIWGAARPWGPWRQVGFWHNWGVANGIERSCFYWNYVPEWSAIVFSGTGKNDRFNAIRVTLKG